MYASWTHLRILQWDLTNAIWKKTFETETIDLIVALRVPNYNFLSVTL